MERSNEHRRDGLKGPLTQAERMGGPGARLGGRNGRQRRTLTTTAAATSAHTGGERGASSSPSPTQACRGLVPRDRGADSRRCVSHQSLTHVQGCLAGSYEPAATTERSSGTLTFGNGESRREGATGTEGLLH